MLCVSGPDWAPLWCQACPAALTAACFIKKLAGATFIWEAPAELVDMQHQEQSQGRGKGVPERSRGQLTCSQGLPTLLLVFRQGLKVFQDVPGDGVCTPGWTAAGLLHQPQLLITEDLGCLSWALWRLPNQFGLQATLRAARLGCPLCIHTRSLCDASHVPGCCEWGQRCKSV